VFSLIEFDAEFAAQAVKINKIYTLFLQTLPIVLFLPLKQ